MLRYILLLSILYSCENKNISSSSKKINIRNVSFETPSNFLLKKSNSVDTSVYDIFFQEKKIGSVYFGYYYQPFVERYSITEEKEIYDKVSSKEAKIYYSKYFEQDYKNGIFNKNYYYTINTNIAQVMLPKKPNTGSIGIYFDSVDVYKNKFAIVSNNLSEENKKKFLKIFKTIKIK
jgi:hypothetical protein